MQVRNWGHAGNCLLFLDRTGKIGMPRQFHLTGLYKTDFITYYTDLRKQNKYKRPGNISNKSKKQSIK